MFPPPSLPLFSRNLLITRGQPARVVVEEAAIMASYRKNPTANRVTTDGPINSDRVNYNQRFRASGLSQRLIYEDKMSELIYKMVDPYRRVGRGRAMAVMSSSPSSSSLSTVNNDVLANIPPPDCMINWFSRSYDHAISFTEYLLPFCPQSTRWVLFHCVELYRTNVY